MELIFLKNTFKVENTFTIKITTVVILCGGVWGSGKWVEILHFTLRPAGGQVFQAQSQMYLISF